MSEKKKIFKNFFIGLLIAIGISICCVVINMNPTINMLISSMVFLTYFGSMTVITHIHTMLEELRSDVE